MKNQNIWVMRWAFDPPHKWHLEVITTSIQKLTLDKIYVIIKMIWEKDPAASTEQRIEMMKKQIWYIDTDIEVIRHNIQWHTQELISLHNKHEGSNIINICWSDKSKRELEVYWKKWDIFLINNRPWYDLQSTYETSKKLWINIIQINPIFNTSSTYVRENINQGKIFQQWLDENISKYILENGLYLPYNKSKNKQDFILLWFKFVEKLIPLFQDLHLLDIEIPDFNAIQSKNAWREKYIRTIVRSRKLKWDNLVSFVTQAEKIEIGL